MKTEEVSSRLLNAVPKPTPNFPFMIGVAGGSSSGKSEVCERIVEALGQNCKSAKEKQVYIVNQDSFYRNFNKDELKKAAKFEFNFDHPTAVDIDKMKVCLKAIKNYESVTIPQYNYVTHTMLEDETSTIGIHSADVVIVEGILVFYDKELRELFDLKLFVDTDSDTRLARRVLRDTEERGRNLDSVLSQYTKFVKPAFEEFCLPTKKYADVIIPRGNDNKVAVSLIVQHIQDLLQCNANSRRSSSASSRNSSIPGSPLNRSIDHITQVGKLTSKAKPVSNGNACGKNSGNFIELPHHIEEYPSIKSQHSTTSVNMTNSVH